MRNRIPRSIRPVSFLLTIFLLLLPAPTLSKTTTENSPEPSRMKARGAPAEQPMRTDADWRYRTDRTGTFATRLYRRDFNHVLPTRIGDDPVVVARDFLMENADRLGLQAARAKTGINDLEVARSRQSLSGHHVTFRQTVGGVPVFRGEVVVNMTGDNMVYSVLNDYRRNISLDVAPVIDAVTAKRTALETIAPSHLIGDVKSDLYVMDIEGTYRLVRRVTVPADEPMGDWVVVVDARTGDVLSVHDQAMYATGTGQVFDPDPMTKLNDDTLTDQNDADAAIPAGGYDTRTLTDLDAAVGGLYSLSGTWASIIDNELPTVAPPTLADPNAFIYTRNPDEFEAVNCYFQITNIQSYIQSLGFTNANARQQPIDAHGLSGDDNSHYVPSTGNIAFGDGGVDDAEDADVIIHEYGHAIQDNIVPGWGGGQEGAMGEGFGDYLAGSYSYSINPLFHPDWVFTWDGHNSFWAGRVMIDSTLHYPEDANGEVHASGTLWCSSLWNQFKVLGRGVVDPIVIDHHFALTTSATMADAANEVINSDIAIFGGAHVQTLVTIFGYWGMVDPAAFIPTITHTPLSDTEDGIGPYTVTAVITSVQPLDPASLNVIYGTAGSFTDTLLMTPTANPNEYSADIPGPLNNVDVRYYITAADSGGGSATDPSGAPASFHQFHVGSDLVPPVIVHGVISDFPWIRWPAPVSATVTDNLGVNPDSVWVEWRQNTVSQGRFPLVRQGATDTYSASFPSDTLSAIIGDVIEYKVVARDISTNENIAADPASGFHAFKLIAALGVVLVLDDDGVPKEAPGIKAVKGRPDEFAPERDPSSIGKTAVDIEAALNGLGYVATTEAAATSDPLTWGSYSFLVSTSGANTSPVADATYRTNLENYVAGGGKLIIEGGEVGYDAISSPGYPTFAANVLHGGGWNADNAGNLSVVAGQSTHPIVTTPNILTGPFTIAYAGYGDEDAITPADASTYVVLETATDPGSGGVLVYDDNPAPGSAQIVYFAFNYSAFADSAARTQLLANTGAFLLASEGTASGSISGSVDLVGLADDSGAIVTAGGVSDTTDAAGSYQINGLYAATYTVTASKPGFATGTQTGVVVLEAQNTPNIDFTLSPITIDTLCNGSALVINDNDTLASAITISGDLTVSDLDVSVDITHTYIGDLRVHIESPAGTVVTLHNRTGSGTDNIVTTYDALTAPDGPGTMADFLGESTLGTWYLSITDNAAGDTGKLNGWCLIYTYGSISTEVNEAGALPRSFALGPNRPNPFNPVTTIAFDVPRRSLVRLAIYNANGRLVRTLVNGTVDAGVREATWDGTNDSGQGVSSGVYFVRIEAGDFNSTRKIALIR